MIWMIYPYFQKVPYEKRYRNVLENTPKSSESSDGMS